MKYADYIKQIEIDSLWDGGKHILWNLDPQINILSGVNGGGKSTILRYTLSGARRVKEDEAEGVHIITEPADAEYVRYDKVDMPEVRSDFDINLKRLTDRYVQHMHDEVHQKQFFDLVDKLFSTTGKSVDRTRKELTLRQYGRDVPMKVLSNGEKQMLTILLTAYLENHQHYTLFMDEPEVSLHLDWQKSLISNILKLNPCAQIILTTHSPAVIMDGWADRVTEVEEITVAPSLGS